VVRPASNGTTGETEWMGAGWTGTLTLSTSGYVITRHHQSVVDNLMTEAPSPVTIRLTWVFIDPRAISTQHDWWLGNSLSPGAVATHNLRLLPLTGPRWRKWRHQLNVDDLNFNKLSKWCVYWYVYGSVGRDWYSYQQAAAVVKIDTNAWCNQANCKINILCKPNQLHITISSHELVLHCYWLLHQWN